MKLRNKFYYVGLGLAGGRDLGFGFGFGFWTWVSPSGDLEPANQYEPSKKPAGELKSPWAPKFEQKPAPFVPIELL